MLLLRDKTKANRAGRQVYIAAVHVPRNWSQRCHFECEGGGEGGHQPCQGVLDAQLWGADVDEKPVGAG